MVVVGAGCFGAWTAWQLRAAGRSVLLVDQYGPANARASSGGESRAIRMSYGPDELYTRLSARSLALWKAFFAETGSPRAVPRTGVLWMSRGETPDAAASLTALAAAGIRARAARPRPSCAGASRRSSWWTAAPRSSSPTAAC